MRKRFIRFVAAGGTALSLMPNAAWAQAPTDSDRYACWGPQMMGWGGGWNAMIFGPLFMILVLGVVVAVAVLLVRWLAGPWHSIQMPHHMAPGRTPLDILKERYARGEIDKEEFEERRRNLGN